MNRAEYQKEYRIKNSEKLKQYHKKYYQENKMKLSKQQREYYQENKDAVLARNNNYQKQNRNKLKKYHAIWRSKNKDKIQKICQKYYSNNKEEVFKRNKDWRKNNPEKVLQINTEYRNLPKEHYRIYKRNAAVRGIEFKITIDEFMLFWQAPCGYCGAPIETIGLDRIDSAIGYFVDNIVPCCTTCNKMKMTLSQNAFIKHCFRIVLHNIMGVGNEK